jgi:hypothetical protein
MRSFVKANSGEAQSTVIAGGSAETAEEKREEALKEPESFVLLTEATRIQLDILNGDLRSEPSPLLADKKQAAWLMPGQWAARGAGDDDDGIYEEFHDEEGMVDGEGDGGSDAAPSDTPVTPSRKTVARIDDWWELNDRVRKVCCIPFINCLLTTPCLPPI